MRNYDPNEALLFAWAEKLKAIKNTKRVELQKELLAILEQKNDSAVRLQEFQEKRAKLLSSNHGLDSSWTPRTGWFWRTLSAILPSFTPSFLRPAQGSSLRAALIDEPFYNKNKKLGITATLSDEAFEKELFHNPEVALRDLDKSIADFYRLPAEEQNAKKLTSILERLNAIKLMLTPSAYRYYIEPFFESHPAKTVSFFYHSYKKEQHDILDNSHEFIELHFMSQALLKTFVLKEETINSRLYQAQYLLLLLCFSKAAFTESFQNQNIDLLSTLLQRWKGCGELPPSLSAMYKELSVKIIPSLSEKNPKVTENRKSKARLTGRLDNIKRTLSEDQIYELPLRLLEDVVTIFKPNLHRLLTHVALQLAEEFGMEDLGNLTKPREEQDKGKEKELNLEANYSHIWETNHIGHQVLGFLEQILQPGKDHPVKGKGLSSKEHYIEFLQLNQAIIPAHYRHAEFCAITINLAYSTSEGEDAKAEALKTASILRSHYKYFFNEDELDWIKLRLNYRIAPDFIPVLMHVLIESMFYKPDNIFVAQVEMQGDSIVSRFSPLDNDDLPADVQYSLCLKSMDTKLLGHLLPELEGDFFYDRSQKQLTLKPNFQNRPTEELIKYMLENLDQAEQGRLALDKEEETVANIKTMLGLFLFFKKTNLTTHDLEEANKILTRLHPLCLSDELTTIFLQKLWLLQIPLLHWTENYLLVLDNKVIDFCTKAVEADDDTAPHPLAYADKLCNKAMACQGLNTLNSFVEQEQYLLGAIYFFHQFMQNKDVTRLEQAENILHRLFPYVAGDLYKNWANELDKPTPWKNNPSDSDCHIISGCSSSWTKTKHTASTSDSAAQHKDSPTIGMRQ